MTILFWIIAVIICLAAGAAIGFLLRKYVGLRSIDSAERKAEDIITEAKTKQKQLLLEANEKAIKVIEGGKVEADQRRQELTLTRSVRKKRGPV
jgi:hypothetical protein